MLLGAMTMMKAVLGTWVMAGLLLLAGCGEGDDGPRLGGRVVSHVDAYGSGTGGEAGLDVEGSMSC